MDFLTANGINWIVAIQSLGGWLELAAPPEFSVMVPMYCPTGKVAGVTVTFSVAGVPPVVGETLSHCTLPGFGLTLATALNPSDAPLLVIVRGF